MFQLPFRGTILLVNMLMVHGLFQSDNRNDRNHVDHYQRISSNNYRSHSVHNADSALRFPTHNQYHPGLDLERGLPNGLPSPVAGKIRTGQEINQPVIKKLKHDTTTANTNCQNLRGLPTPESGCCGVHLKKSHIRHILNDSFLPFQSNRIRRSVDSSLAPRKMINGGLPVEMHQLPWMVRLVIKPYFPGVDSPKHCGGTIISSRYVITAAHCLYKTYINLEQLEVIIAEYKTDTFPMDCWGRQCIENTKIYVENVILHPQYDNKNLHNDIALMRMSSYIQYTGLMQPICLPTVDIKEVSNNKFIIAGWGLNGKTKSNLKRAAIVNYVTNDKCKEHYNYLDDEVFCSIGENGQDVCSGDSGGPLMVKRNGKFFLSGIASGKRQDQTCGSSIPSLFINVFSHLNWIKSHVT